VLCAKANKISITEMFKELRLEIKDKIKVAIDSTKTELGGFRQFADETRRIVDHFPSSAEAKINNLLKQLVAQQTVDFKTMLRDFEVFKTEQREVLDRNDSKKLDFKKFQVTKTQFELM
jgi:hypothetical protein